MRIFKNDLCTDVQSDEILQCSIILDITDTGLRQDGSWKVFLYPEWVFLRIGVIVGHLKVDRKLELRNRSCAAQ